MADVTTRSSSKMTDVELHAVATYLKDQPPSEETPQPVATSDATMKLGGMI